MTRKRTLSEEALYQRALRVWTLYQELLSQGAPERGARRKVAQMMEGECCEKTVYNLIAWMRKELGKETEK